MTAGWDQDVASSAIANLFMGNHLGMDSPAKPETFFYGPLVLLQDLAMRSTLDLSSCRRLRISPVHDLEVVSGPSGLRATCILKLNAALALRNGTERAKL
jgi:hypothetical protein